MRAWLLKDQIGIGSLELASAADPSPGAGEVLLRVNVAALNPADRYLSEGQYPAKPPMPHVLGRDGAGTVTAIGAGVSGVNVGEHRVILRGETGVSRAGTFAEFVSVSNESLVPVPDGWTVEQAGAAPLVYLTAYQALTQWDELPPSIVLITGASGGVGVAAVQLAAAMGHSVAALSRDAGKRDRLMQLGASWAFDPADGGWRQSLKSALSGRRVGLAVDNIGGTLLPEVIETLGDRGRVSCVGQLAGPVPRFNTATLFFRRARLGGVAVGAYTAAESQAAWKRVLALLDRSGARPLIDHVFAFDQLPQAFERLKSGPMGKVLLAVHAERFGNE